MDVEDSQEIADGMCVLLARESNEEGGEGINKIVAADDGLLWTASGSSKISRWKIPRRLVKRDTGDDKDFFSDPSLTTNGVSSGVEQLGPALSSMHQGNFTGHLVCSY